jgi:hypothetical protein
MTQWIATQDFDPATEAGEYSWQALLLAGTVVLKSLPSGAFVIGPDPDVDVTWRAPQAGGSAVVAPTP